MIATRDGGARGAYGFPSAVVTIVMGGQCGWAMGFDQREKIYSPFRSEPASAILRKPRTNGSSK